MEPIRTDIPARLDRLPWSRFHWLVVLALGASWAIDGLEVTLTGAVSGVLQHPATLNLDSEQIGGLGSFYLAGAVVGALVCGHLTDRHGRAKLFFATLAVYLAGTLATAFTWNFASMAVCRIVTGFGIGGEYAAINSAIDELIPARVRGQVNLGINGSYWIGTALGSVATLVLLDPQFFPIDVGWRAGFFIGALLGFAVLIARRYVPESPRWLTIHGQHDKAMRIVADIESRAGATIQTTPIDSDDVYIVHPRMEIGFRRIVQTLVRDYPRRALLGLVLIASQAFLYNAIFFTYALVLSRFYEVPAAETGLYLLPFAIGNFLGPLLLGRWFDRWGRRAMIAGTYTVSAVLLWITGWLFARGALSAAEQTFLWCTIFFFASAAASSAYLTISEIFPLELRALAIALFYAAGTAIGGIAAPWIFGLLIGSGSREAVSNGYAFGAAFMLVAAVVEGWLGVDAERKSLERIATPLSAHIG